jgi:hypothetical protein
VVGEEECCSVRDTDCCLVAGAWHRRGTDREVAGGGAGAEGKQTRGERATNAEGLQLLRGHRPLGGPGSSIVPASLHRGGQDHCTQGLRRRRTTPRWCLQKLCLSRALHCSKTRMGWFDGGSQMGGPQRGSLQEIIRVYPGTPLSCLLTPTCRSGGVFLTTASRLCQRGHALRELAGRMRHRGGRSRSCHWSCHS